MTLQSSTGHLFHLLLQHKMAAAAVIIAAIAYALQYRRTWQGKSEPNPISWHGFGFLTGVGFLVQVQKGAGGGSWVMGFTSICCFLVAIISQLKKKGGWKKKDFTAWDWASLAAGILLFFLYLALKDVPRVVVTAAVVAASADVVLYYPTFRRAWLLPEKEYLPSYALNSLKFVPSIFAMETYSTATLVYPIAMIVINMIVVYYARWRRKVLAKEEANQYAHHAC